MMDEDSDWVDVTISAYNRKSFKLRILWDEWDSLAERAQVQEDGLKYDPRSATWTMGGQEFTDEELERKRQEARAKYERPQYRSQSYGNFFGFDDGFRYHFDSASGNRFRYGFTPPQDSKPKQPPKEDTPREQLRKLAGVSAVDAAGMSTTSLKRRAMRKCHPDTGGSHEEWLDLVNVCKKLGIPV